MEIGKKTFDSNLLGQCVIPAGVPSVPVECMGPGSWMLPSGKALAEFAFEAGFLAPLFLRAPDFPARGLRMADAGAGSGPKRAVRRKQRNAI